MLLPCQEQGCCVQNLALFASVDGRRWRRKSGRPAVAHLDKCEAVAIQHDQVNLAAAPAEVLCDGFQALSDKVGEGASFGPVS